MLPKAPLLPALYFPLLSVTVVAFALIAPVIDITPLLLEVRVTLPGALRFILVKDILPVPVLDTNASPVPVILWPIIKDPEPELIKFLRVNVVNEFVIVRFPLPPKVIFPVPLMTRVALPVMIWLEEPL